MTKKIFDRGKNTVSEPTIEWSKIDREIELLKAARTQPQRREPANERDPRDMDIMAALKAGVVSKQSALEGFGIDYGAEVAKIGRVSAARRAAEKRKGKKQAEAARATMYLEENFIPKWRGGPFFKRGDVARVLQIRPKGAGRLLHLAEQALTRRRFRVVEGWWSCTPSMPGVYTRQGKRPGAPTTFDMLNLGSPYVPQALPPLPPPANIFGNK